MEGQEDVEGIAGEGRERPLFELSEQTGTEDSVGQFRVDKRRVADGAIWKHGKGGVDRGAPNRFPGRERVRGATGEVGSMRFDDTGNRVRRERRGPAGRVNDRALARVGVINGFAGLKSGIRLWGVGGSWWIGCRRFGNPATSVAKD